MSSAGFEPVIPAIERPQTYVIDRMAIGIGGTYFRKTKFNTA
jgi:hypothetical protein